MDLSDYLGDDGQVLLALCSAFGVPEAQRETGANPLTLSEWNDLERQLQRSSLRRPAGLRGRPAADLVRELVIAASEAERIVELLDRSEPLAAALEDLFSSGLWVLSRADDLYPAKLRQTLKLKAPVVLFGAGELGLLKKPAVAVVGSRNIDEAGVAFAQEVGRKAVAARMAVVSGGARGSDRIAMDGALQAGGAAIGVLADSLEATVRKPDVSEFLHDGRLLLLTPYVPTAGFSVGGAMGRNKVIYGLSDFSVVVISHFQTRRPRAR